MEYFFKCLISFIGVFVVNFLMFTGVWDGFWSHPKEFFGDLIIRCIGSILSIVIAGWICLKDFED